LIRPLGNIAPPDWRQWVSSSISDPKDLPAELFRGAGPKALRDVSDRFPMRVNPYVLALIEAADDPIGRQVIPCHNELEDDRVALDPLCEERQSPAPQVIHRYPQRVVLLVSNQCAVHCRFCMRKRRVGGGQVPLDAIERGIAYIRSHSQINEVILSGGDPLMRSDETLSRLLDGLRAIPHIRLLRIHTRLPSVLPMRITPSLVERLSRHHPLYINIHFNHPAEITAEARRACAMLADAGIPLGSQTVLLKGVNDDAGVLFHLFESLLAMRVRPYYLHQLDRVPGTAHFHVPVERGVHLLESLRGRLSGMGMPHYMVDLPGGGGKVALTPEVVLDKGAGHWRIKNWEGRVFQYPLGR